MDGSCDPNHRKKEYGSDSTMIINHRLQMGKGRECVQQIKSNSMIARKMKSIIGSELTSSIAASFLSEKKSPAHDLVFIRHAQSVFNQTCEEYRKIHNIPYVWKALCSHEGFDERVLFNYDFVDTRITELGKKQCQETRKEMKEEEIDCILVSPQTRALETYQQIFKNRGIPVFAEPLLSGPLRSCCDLSKPTIGKLNQFPEVNFRAMHEIGDLWFLDYLPFEQQILAIKRLQKRKLASFKERCQELLKMLKEQSIFEDHLQYRRRIQMAKYRMAEYQRKYKKVAVVAHYYTIEYLTAKQFEECGAPVYTRDIQNCKPYYASMSDLLSVKENFEAEPRQYEEEAELALA